MCTILFPPPPPPQKKRKKEGIFPFYCQCHVELENPAHLHLITVGDAQGQGYSWRKATLKILKGLWSLVRDSFVTWCKAQGVPVRKGVWNHWKKGGLSEGGVSCRHLLHLNQNQGVSLCSLTGEVFCLFFFQCFRYTDTGSRVLWCSDVRCFHQ